MKRFFYKIESFIIALIVLFSTFSFTVEQHYCGDVLVDFSLFGEAESCGMEKEGFNSHDLTLVEKNCCSDEILSVDGQDNLKISFEQLNPEQQLFIVSFVYSYINPYQGTDIHIVPFKNYSPPPLIRDILTFDQTFLI